MERFEVNKLGKAKGITAFQKRVYTWLSNNVPAGSVTTYSRISRELKASPRAVGQALKNNTFAPLVPCHRVVKSDRSIGGFGGHSSGVWIRRKKKLLKSERVNFKNGRINKEFILE